MRLIAVEDNTEAGPLEAESIVLLKDLGRFPPLLVPLGGEPLLLGLLLGKLLLHLLQHSRVPGHDGLEQKRR